MYNNYMHGIEEKTKVMHEMSVGEEIVTTSVLNAECFNLTFFAKKSTSEWLLLTFVIMFEISFIFGLILLNISVMWWTHTLPKFSPVPLDKNINKLWRFCDSSKCLLFYPESYCLRNKKKTQIVIITVFYFSILFKDEYKEYANFPSQLFEGVLERETRYSLTIRHVPKTTKLKIKFGK